MADGDRRAADRATRLAAGSRAATVSLSVSGDGLPRFADAVAALGGRQARRAYVLALNHTGRKAQTAVIRALARQVGLPQGRLRALGRIRSTSAEHSPAGEPAFVIRSTGRYLPLGEFRPAQFSYGVRANPWGRAQRFEGAFIFAGNRRSGQRMPGGNVFYNSRRFNPASGRNNLALPMWGPAIPKEMVRDESRQAFEGTARELGPRVAHELRRLTGGVVS